jgi:hypothetical protein
VGLISERAGGDLADRDSLREPEPLQGVFRPQMMSEEKAETQPLGRGLYFLNDIEARDKRLIRIYRLYTIYVRGCG